MASAAFRSGKEPGPGFAGAGSRERLADPLPAGADCAAIGGSQLAEEVLARIKSALLLLDRDNRVVLANPAFFDLFPIISSNVFGQRPVDPTIGRLIDAGLRALRNGDSDGSDECIAECVVPHDRPSPRSFRIVASRIPDRYGNGRSTLLAIEDVTEKQRLETDRQFVMGQLQQADDDIRTFARTVAHDLKAPLRGIATLADWITAGQGDRLDAGGRQQLRLLNHRVRRLEAFIDGLLQWGCLERCEAIAGPVDLNTVVFELIETLAPPPHIAVSADRLPVLRVERFKIQQVFQNLLDNAIRLMDKPCGFIEIGCVARGADWLFSVKDNGPGIESRDADSMFQLFQTLNPRDRMNTKGIGLAIVNRIIESWHGKVWVESVPGRGSTFLFTLPRALSETLPADTGRR